jgi:hypothetical protein
MGCIVTSMIHYFSHISQSLSAKPDLWNKGLAYQTRLVVDDYIASATRNRLPPGALVHAGYSHDRTVPAHATRCAGLTSYVT